MGGLGVFAWLAIGAAAGMIGAVLVVAHVDIGLHPALGSRVHTLAARMRAS